MEMTDISDEEVKRFKLLLYCLKGFARDRITPAIEKHFLEMLKRTIPHFANFIIFEEYPELMRLTINRRVHNPGQNKRIYDIEKLKYPKPEWVSRYGRCNKPHTSVLYAGFDRLTILGELKPKIGDLITVSKWRAKPGTRLKVSPIFKNQPFNEEMINPRTKKLDRLFEEKLESFPKNIREIIDALIRFVADAFTKRVNSDNHLDYIFSAFFADYILNEAEGGSIDAINYPSVQGGLCFENIAMKPNVFDKNYELASVSDSIVEVDLSNGRNGYGLVGLGDCNSFDLATGKILWGDNLYLSNNKLTEAMLLYDLEL